MVTLKNSSTVVEISEIGAELKSIKHNGTEIMWQGDPNFWAGTAPIVFPICGLLPEGKFVLNNKEYSIGQHGFIRFETFEIESISDTSVTLLSKSSAETLKNYPWEYEFRAIFTLHGSALDVTYDVKNLSDSKMLFQLGSHEGFSCPEGIEEYDVIFEKNETLDSYKISGPYLLDETYRVLKDSRVLPLYYSYFAIDALVFKDIKSRSVTLKNRKTGRSVSLSFPDHNYFILWTKPDAPYICIEPWCGTKGFKDDSFDLSKREGIESLNSGKNFRRTHTIFMD